MVPVGNDTSQDIKPNKFAVFDIDGTLIRWQLYHAIADALDRFGDIDSSEYQKIKAARMAWKRREESESFIKYELELVRLYENILTTITVDQFEKAASAVFSEYKDQVYVYTRNLLKDLKKTGYLLFAISGSQSQIISKMACYYQFDDFAAREEQVRNKRFTGQATSPIFNKDQVLKSLVKKHGADYGMSIGVGDSFSDVKMLELVAKPIAFNPERKLFEIARERNWKIVIERKNMIYELDKQGNRYALVKTNV
jgi:HAD superfamily phosphoserine phosphatase-like hydrolase